MLELRGARVYILCIIKASGVALSIFNCTSRRTGAPLPGGFPTIAGLQSLVSVLELDRRAGLKRYSQCSCYQQYTLKLNQCNTQRSERDRVKKKTKNGQVSQICCTRVFPRTVICVGEKVTDAGNVA